VLEDPASRHFSSLPRLKFFGIIQISLTFVSYVLMLNHGYEYVATRMMIDCVGQGIATTTIPADQVAASLVLAMK
jgi:hypothetical protein